MTWLLNCRALPGGGPVRAADVLTNPPDQLGVAQAQLISTCRGCDVMVATHGFNVNQQEGADHLTRWVALLALPADSVYIGYLWPGDSVWLHALIYPEAAKVAMQSGDQLAAWVNQNLSEAASVSFVSHSLGARVVLRAIQGLASTIRVRRLLLMAGAVDDTCLKGEFAAAAQRVEKISNLSSSEDDVLKWAFPLGNPLSGIFAEGHPFWHAAIGREGPSGNPPAPAQLDKVCRMPDLWNYGHDDYLPPSPVPAGYVSLPYTLPIDSPAPPTEPAANTPAGYETTAGVWAPYWKSAWTAGFESTRFP
jgi:hypothetical protein